MVAAALCLIAGKVQLTEVVARAVADIGLVHTADGVSLTVGEVLLLKANCTASTSEACVAPCQTICGWVIRSTTAVFCDSIHVDNIYWGRLVERRKEASIKF